MRARLASLGWILALVACAAGASETERIVEALAIAPGDRIADVGAGDGEWARRLADHVGPSGRVFATEVDDELVAGLEEMASGIDNLVVLRGEDDDSGLPPGCCDAILLRLVYHHFTDPAAMRRSLRRALAPGGRLAVVDILPQSDWRELPEVPDRGGHGLSPETLIAEMTADGFTVRRRIDDWRADDADRYCVVFEVAD